MAYRGSVTRLPIGMLGFSGSRNPTQLQAGHFAEVDNVTLDGGLIQKLGGAIKLNAAAIGAPSKVLAGINYSPLSGVTRDAVFLENGTILKDSGLGTFPVTLAAGLGIPRDPPPYFMMAGGEAVGSPRTLFCFMSTNQVRVVDGDGAAMAALTTPPADWAGADNFPTFGVLHEGRLWAGGNASDPHRIYYSRPTDHQDFSAPGGTLAVHPGEGERLVGGISFRGLLMLWKYPRGVYMINTSDPTAANWRVERLSDAVGGVNQNLILQVDNDTIYMDSGGNIHALSATNAFGGVMTSNISQKNDLSEFMHSQIDMTKLKRCSAVWYPSRQHALFSLKSITGADLDTILTVDFSNPQMGPRFLKSMRDVPISMWTRPDSTGDYHPVHGDASGFVWLMDRDARSKDGAGYGMSFSTSNTDLSFIDPILATKNKSGDFLEIVFEPQGDWDLLVQVFWDDIPMPPLLYSMGGDGAPLGSFTLDTDMLVATAIRSIRKRITGQGRRLRLEVSQQGSDQNVAISDFFLSFRATDERAGKTNA